MDVSNHIIYLLHFKIVKLHLRKILLTSDICNEGIFDTFLLFENPPVTDPLKLFNNKNRNYSTTLPHNVITLSVSNILCIFKVTITSPK